MNARSDRNSSIYGITKSCIATIRKLLFKPPFALDEFRREAKRHLENTSVSIKAKIKLRQIISIHEKAGGTNKKYKQPHGQLHKETIYVSKEN